MKKMLAFVAISATLLSCSNDYDADDDFYGLSTTKVLVYKKYTIDENGVETYTNKIDTVKVFSKQKINGINYYKLHHSVYHDSSLESQTDEYRRVDGKGYLVDEHNAVIHPGFETNYTYTEEISTTDAPSATAVYKLGGGIGEISLQNSSFAVYSYLGIAQNLQGGNPAGVVMERGYAAALGMAKSKIRNPGSNTYLEDRLVAYQRN